MFIFTFDNAARKDILEPLNRLVMQFFFPFETTYIVSPGGFFSNIQFNIMIILTKFQEVRYRTFEKWYNYFFCCW